MMSQACALWGEIANHKGVCRIDDTRRKQSSPLPPRPWEGPLWDRPPRGLLLRQVERKFAVADAQRKPLGESSGRLLAIGRDKFGEGREQTSLREAIAVDAVEARLGPGLVQIAERRALVLAIPHGIVSRNHVNGHAPCRIVAAPPARPCAAR